VQLQIVDAALGARTGNIPDRGYEILSSKSANAERSRARSAAGFDDSLAAVACRTAVIAVMAGYVVKIAALGRRKRPRGIADDEGSLA
jgi:hypothetical protein